MRGVQIQQSVPRIPLVNKDDKDLIEQLNERIEAIQGNRSSRIVQTDSNEDNFKRITASQPFFQIKEPKEHSYPRKDKKAKTSNPRRKKLQNSYSNDSEIMEYINKALNLEKLSGLELLQYQKIIAGLNEKRAIASGEKRIREGLKINRAIQHVQSYIDRINEKRRILENFNDFDQKMEEFRNDLAEFDEETKNMENEFIRKKEIQRNVLIDSQNDDIIDFQELWTSPAKQRQFNRASNLLYELRRRQEIYLKCNDFDGASEIQRHIKRQERIESEQCSTAFQHAYDEALLKLKIKHKKELENFDEKARNELVFLRQQRSNLRQGLENRRKKIKANAGKCKIHNDFYSVSPAADIRTSLKLKDRVIDANKKDINSVVLRPLVLHTDIRKH